MNFERFKGYKDYQQYTWSYNIYDASYDITISEVNEYL